MVRQRIKLRLTAVGGKHTGLGRIKPGIPALLLRRLPQMLSSGRRDLSIRQRL